MIYVYIVDYIPSWSYESPESLNMAKLAVDIQRPMGCSYPWTPSKETTRLLQRTLYDSGIDDLGYSLGLVLGSRGWGLTA